LPIVQVGGDLGLVGALVERRLELVQVELELRGVLLDVGAGHRLLVLEEDVMHLPELALLAGGQRGLGADLGVLVHRQREVLEDDADVLGVGRVLDDLVQHVGELGAERALEVGELDDRDQRLVGAGVRVLLAVGDAEALALDLGC
jgi:hypothetical protein